MKWGIVVASFGTTHQETAEKTILPLEREIRAAYPEWTVVGGYTSRKVHHKLKERGEPVFSVEEALMFLAEQGVTDVLVQPTHLIPGEEYEKLCAIVDACRDQFTAVRVGRPLLDSNADVELVSRIVMENYQPMPQEALVLMGHGTAHAADHVYADMDAVFQRMGYGNVFIATVEGRLTLESAVERVTAAGYTHVTLAPLMLVAGDHAVHDMAGDSDESWKSVFQQRGCTVRICLRGLGELPPIRALYRSHLRAIEEGIR